ncbi:MAG: galactitol-1-phosphate 5-dehydrogenase [Propionicimonas sp.]
MQAWQFHAIGDFLLDDIPQPVPTGQEILVRIRAAGVCGSDIPRVFELGARVSPVVLGHEFAGEVVAVGDPADEELLGRRAAVFPLIPCRRCAACVTGHYVQCRRNGYLGSRDNGGFAEYCLVPSRWHLLLADDQIPFSSLAMVEPSSVALHALRRAQVGVKDRVLVMGAGPIGLVLGRLAALSGATVVTADVVPDKIEFARERSLVAVRNEPELVLEALGGEADVVIEGTGAGVALSSAATITRPGGRIVLMGNPHRDTTIQRASHSEILRRELSLLGVWNSTFLGEFDSDWTAILALMASHDLEVEDLITDRLAMPELGPTMRAVHDRELAPCKMMLELP